MTVGDNEGETYFPYCWHAMVISAGQTIVLTKVVEAVVCDRIRVERSIFVFFELHSPVLRVSFNVNYIP